MVKKSADKDAALIIFLEDKNREQVQSHFSDALDTSDANALYRAFVEDTIYTCLEAGAFEVIISYPEGNIKKVVDEAINTLKRVLRGKKRARLDKTDGWLWEQGQADTSRDMAVAIDRCFDLGYERVILIDCVTPSISKIMLQNANTVLKKKDIVFGPTLEGSFYLLGMSSPTPQLFKKIDWSDKERIYPKMVEVACVDKLNWEELELWYNLCQPGDLEFLARDINAFRIVGDERSAMHTEKVLEELIRKFQSEET